MATPRLHIEDRELVEGDCFDLPPAASRHVQVLRLQPGQGVVLFTGRDVLEWPAEITRIGRREVEVRLGASRPAAGRELAVAVTLAVGMPANERMDMLIEKATELGVAAVQPLLCERSVVRLAGDRAQARQRHWQAVAAAASEQCGRTRVPEITLPARLDRWLQGLADAPSSARVVLSLGAQATSPPQAGLTSGKNLLVLSGPEGGLSPAEESSALDHGFDAVTLGPRTLRADTAPLALLAWLGLAMTRKPS